MKNKQVDYKSVWFTILDQPNFLKYVAILTHKLQIFLIHRLLNFWLQHFWNIELQNSLLSNINDNGDNNTKTKKLKNPGGNI